MVRLRPEPGIEFILRKTRPKNTHLPQSEKGWGKQQNESMSHNRVVAGRRDQRWRFARACSSAFGRASRE